MSAPLSWLTAPQCRKPTLLTLPVELSEEIFRFVLPFNVIHILCHDWYGDGPYTPEKWSNYLSDWRSGGDLSKYRGMKFCGKIEKDHLSLLLVCRETYGRASRILYSRNVFEYTILSRRVHAVDFASQMLERLGSASRSLIRNLCINPLILCPHEAAPGPDEYILFELWEGRLQVPIENFCDLVLTMDLTELVLGVKMGFSRDQSERFNDAQGLQALLDLAGQASFRARIVIWGQGQMKRNDSRRVFLKKLTGDMKARRSLVAGGNSAGLIEYVDSPANTEISHSD